MRIISLNLNGIRAAARKGVYHWLQQQDADVICVQETRAHCNHYPEHAFSPDGYHAYFHDAAKKGYSGVGIYSKLEPQHVEYNLGWSVADEEGRYIQIDFSQLSIASLYMPSGTSGEARQRLKYEFMDRFLPKLVDIAHGKRDFIICGDWNIAHKEIDLKNWRANQDHSGFLPAERAWLDEVFDKVGLVDAFRVINDQPGQYTWWSNFGRAWEKNVGWRIDYQIVTRGLKNKILAAEIYKQQRFSDHAPLIIDYDYVIK